jgi:hypothetical protein
MEDVNSSDETYWLHWEMEYLSRTFSMNLGK